MSQWINCQFNKNKKHRKRKSLWDIKGTSEDQWNSFSTELETYLTENNISKIDHTSTIHSPDNNNETDLPLLAVEDIDLKWKYFLNGVISKGRKHLTKARVPRNKIKFNWHNSQKFGLLRLIRKLIRTFDKWYSTDKIINKGKKLALAHKIFDISKIITTEYGNIINEFPDYNNLKKLKKWRENVFHLWYTMRKEIKYEARSETNKIIKQRIIRRQSQLKTAAKKMINNIFDANFRRITLDQIVQTLPDSSIHIITSPQEIKNTVKNHLFNWNKSENPPILLEHLLKF